MVQFETFVPVSVGAVTWCMRGQSKEPNMPWIGLLYFMRYLMVAPGFPLHQ